jgi:hypothetical protein
MHSYSTFGHSTLNSQYSPRPRLGGSHHFPLIVYFVHGHGASTQMSFCPGTPNGSLKIPKLGLLQFCEAITLCVNLWLKWGLKQSCSPHQKLSKRMSHITYTQGNWGDSWLLMVGSQIWQYVPRLFFWP